MWTNMKKKNIGHRTSIFFFYKSEINNRWKNIDVLNKNIDVFCPSLASADDGLSCELFPSGMKHAAANARPSITFTATHSRVSRWSSWLFFFSTLCLTNKLSKINTTFVYIFLLANVFFTTSMNTCARHEYV